MKKLINVFMMALSLIIFISIGSTRALDDFKYKLEIDQDGGQIAMQYFKSAPYPDGQTMNERDFYENKQFHKISGELMLNDKRFETRFVAGWYFITLDREHDHKDISLIHAALNGYKNHQQDQILILLAQAASELRAKGEMENLRNPYAGNNLCNVPVKESFIPTATMAQDTDRLLESLKFVYGGTMEALPEGGNETWKFQHGQQMVFSYSNNMLSTYYEKGCIKGEFNQSDDGETANNFLRITSFESWFGN